MKRPIVKIIALLVILGVGLYLAYEFRDQATDSARAPYEGAAARSAIRDSLDLSLPATASAVHCAVEQVERTQFIFASFDVPPIELASLFDGESHFPALREFTPDAGVISAMAALANPKRPWWQVEPAGGAAAAQKSGRRNVAPAVVKWRVQVCTTPATAGLTRVYVAFSEEPVAGQ